MIRNIDSRRITRLLAIKRRANALLVIAVLMFVASHIWGSDAGGWGFVRAAAEAGMVGGVADWFAVTALFRHPFRIPIPHTAIIPRGKDAIGRGLGEFIERSFLAPDHLVERVRQANPAGRVAGWLQSGDHAEQAAKQAAVLMAGIADALAEEGVQQGIAEALTERMENVDVTPVIGAVVDWAVGGGHHQALVTAALRGLSTTLVESEDMLRDRLSQESPWWVPGNVDDIVFQRLNTGLQSFLQDLIDQPDHELRKNIDHRAIALALEMRTSDVLRRRSEQIRDELLSDPKTQEWTAALWASIKTTISEAATTSDSALCQRFERAFLNISRRLQTDEALSEQVNTWTISIVRQLTEQSGGEVASLVASTVDRWDADETAQRLELLIGRDLQFIRINGTIVGSLVGLLIHTAELAFG